MKARKQVAEEIAELFAEKFLTEQFGKEMFISSNIEPILEERGAKLVYQHVKDDQYHGAAVTFNNGSMFVALNTYHPLRMRYFTAAHELWHFIDLRVALEGEYDSERAADRFAAAIMLPKSLIKSSWHELIKTFPKKKVILMIADMSAMPYQAVARRLKEIGVTNLPDEIRDFTEEDWVNYRLESGMSKSPFDESQPVRQFKSYADNVSELVEVGELDFVTAANKISKFSPGLANKLLHENVHKLDIKQENSEPNG